MFILFCPAPGGFSGCVELCDRGQRAAPSAPSTAIRPSTCSCVRPSIHPSTPPSIHPSLTDRRSGVARLLIPQSCRLLRGSAAAAAAAAPVGSPCRWLLSSSSHPHPARPAADAVSRCGSSVRQRSNGRGSGGGDGEKRRIKSSIG